MPNNTQRAFEICANRHLGKALYYDQHTQENSDMPPLPAVDWAKIGKKAPVYVKLIDWDKDNSSLPKADVVIMVDTQAEWSALDQVFLDPGDERQYYSGYAWQGKWEYYGKGWKSIENQLTYKSPSTKHEAWGSIAQCTVNGKKVLLVKTDMHISTDGPKIPLTQFVQQIVDEAQPSLFLTTGTAGGAKTYSRLGDVNVTNAAKFDLDGEFSSLPYRNHYYSNDWKPNLDFIKQVKPLLNPVPATREEYKAMLKSFNKSEGTDNTLDDVLNDLIRPAFLKDPDILFFDGTPVLTTNSYVVATTDGNMAEYAAMEMDDAVIAKVCSAAGTAFGCVRNISDPAVNASLGQYAGSSWAEDVYSKYGFYSSYNGALAAWSIVDLM